MNMYNIEKVWSSVYRDVLSTRVAEQGAPGSEALVFPNTILIEAF